MHIHPRIAEHPVCESCGARPSTVVRAVRREVRAVCKPCSGPRAPEGAGLLIHDQRDLEQHVGVYNEMLTMTRAFRAASRCEICGAKPTNTMRYGSRIVVTCAGCVGKLPTPEREAINKSHSEARARLAAAERSIQR
jgi:hypothetical protein